MSKLSNREEFRPLDLDDEIDLYEIWIILKRRKFYIFLSTFVLILLSILYILFTPKIYREFALVSLPYIENRNKELTSFSATKALIESLNQELKKKEYEKLSQQLKLTLTSVKSLESLEVVSFRNEKGKRFFSLHLDGKKPSVLPEALASVVGYLNHNPYLIKQIKGQREVLKQQLVELNKEIPKMEKELNLLKRKIEHPQVKIVGFNPISMYENLISLKSRKFQLKYILSVGIHGYEVVYSTVYKEPIKPKKSLVIGVSTITGLFLGIFIAFFAEWLENARRRFSGAQQQ